jgi:aminoglycoside phosphotransferase (APT) family kinase protein
MSQGSRGRDPDATGQSLEAWLADRLGVASVYISELSIPKAGFSNETILGVARWSDVQGKDCQRDFVARIQPTGHQLFTAPDALRQAAVMSALAGKVPVPKIWLTESDVSILGAPFFLMDRVIGRVPSDVPSWHKRGWTIDLSVDQRKLLHDNALRALSDLHGVPVDSSFEFLGGSAPVGSPAQVLDRFLADVKAMYDWCEPVRLYGCDVIDAAMTHVFAKRPDDITAGIVWFDARVGNIIFHDDMSVAAMVDWEGATLGPREFDVAWWVMFDEYLCEAQGFSRLPGIADSEAVFAQYESISGHTLQHMPYFQVLSGLVLSLINSRLVDLLIRNEVVTPAYGAELVTRITTMTARHL